MGKKPPSRPATDWDTVKQATDLSHPTRCVDEDTLNSEVWKIFDRHPELQCLPVVDKRRIVGLINREAFMTQMAGRFHWEVYGKKACTKIMEEDPLVIDADAPIPTIADQLIATGSPNVLVDSFIVARNNELHGIGYTADVMAVLLHQERKNSRALRQHKDRLEQLVDERTADLLQAKLAAERANQSKGEFLANISHELRTPLHAVLAFSRLGCERGATAPREKLARYFEHVADSATRLSALVQELLDLSMLDSGRTTLATTTADLRQLITKTLGELTPLAARRDIQLLDESHLDVAPVLCDPQRVCQVIRHVVDNAIRYSPEGSPVRVLVRWKYQAGSDENDMPSAAMVYVIDAGPGIPDNELEQIFEHFTQSSATRTGAGGKGLGLALSRQIMRQHGGTITARNNPEGGACFMMEFPVAT